MSQSGDTSQPGRVDPFFAAHGYPPSTPEERAEFEVFWAQCQADWRVEIAEGLGECAPYEATDPVDLEPVNPAPASPAINGPELRDGPELIDGPPIPADLDLTEVFAAAQTPTVPSTGPAQPANTTPPTPPPALASTCSKPPRYRQHHHRQHHHRNRQPRPRPTRGTPPGTPTTPTPNRSKTARLCPPSCLLLREASIVQRGPRYSCCAKSLT